MKTSEKIEILAAMVIYHGAKWFLRVLSFMFIAIVTHLIIKWLGLSLPPYF